MRVVLWIFAIIGFLTMAGFAVLVYAVFHFRPAPPTVASNTVLAVDLTQTVTEKAAGDFFEQFVKSKLVRLPDLLTALKRGADDDRVKGLIVRTGETTLGLAQSEEVRDALLAFRAKGKFAYAYADSFGELENGTRPYYLASGFDEIWLQPTGTVALNGFGGEIEFFKGALDKLGVVADIERRKEFKTGGTQFTETKLPETDRAALQDLVQTLSDQVTAAIADGRHLAPADVKALIDQAPFIAGDALAKHLVDHLGYRDEVETAARAKAGAGVKLVSPANYVAALKAAQPAAGNADGIAIIRATGVIQSGDPDVSPFSRSGDAIGADAMLKAFKAAIDNAHAKAIVFRINSPGGSETASETIWRAVNQAKARGKPVIVSMADAAASGGYYIAVPATKIVAEPMTQTGSIGVYGGKFAIGGLADKLGISHDSIATGKNALFASSYDAFTPEQRQRFSAMIDDAYQTFVARVAAGRHMDFAKVEPLAHGRVWTGAEAKERGLVDELGGIDVAIKLAKAEANLPADQPVPTWEYPEPTGLNDALRHGIGVGDEAESAARVLNRVGALLPIIERIEALEGGRAAIMEPVEAGEFR